MLRKGMVVARQAAATYIEVDTLYDTQISRLRDNKVVLYCIRFCHLS